MALAWLLPLAAWADTVEYIHTDALGTPIAVTDASGNVIQASEYAPYGELLNRAVTDGPGHTGHVSDAATGLTYMQQRYYDPMCGCFLSVDAVTAYGNGDMRFFNRYAYANNNPYKFTDPDGRQSAIPWGQIGETMTTRAVQAGVASQVDSPAPGPGDVVAVGILVYAVGEAAVGVYQAATSDAGNSDGAKTSDRPAGPDGKSGSTGGPGAGKRFGPESAETKAGKEGVPCTCCGKPTANTPGQPNSRERDHIDPKSRGGNNSPENERDSCRMCNREKGARNPDEWPKTK